MRTRERAVKPVAILGACLLLLTSCGAPSGDARPSDSNLITGINLLVSTFGANHPKLVTWKTSALKAQLARKLPTGIDTEAGWLLKWPNPAEGELPQVVVPWTLLAQYPNAPLPYFNHYKGGNLVPQATSTDLVATIIKTEMQSDKYFGAVVDIRSSTINPHWIILFTPFTFVSEWREGPTTGSRPARTSFEE